MAFLSLNKTHIAAGETFRLAFTDRDGNSGDTISYTISGTGITSAHFDSESSLTGTITLDSNGVGFKDFDTTADFPTGNEFVSVAFASTGYTGIALKVYSSFHYTTDEKIEQTDTFNDWRKKSNGLFARVDALEESKINFRSDTIIADGVNNGFYLDFTVSSSETALFDVNIDGITQNPLDSYTIETGSNQINFNEIPPVGASISVVHKYEIGSIAYTTTEDGSVAPQKLSVGAPSWNTSGDLNVIRDLHVGGELFVDNKSLQNIVNDVEVLENTTANIHLSNVFAGSVSYDLLSEDIQTSLGGNLSPGNYLGSIVALNDDLNDPTAHANKWYFVEGAEGLMTGANAPSSTIEDGGYIFSDGATWNVRGASPSNILDDSVSYNKLDNDLKRRADNFTARSPIVWAITDAYNRSPLYLDELGELQFTPKANTIGTDAILDGSITVAKLANDSVNKNAILDDSVSYNKLDNDLKRRADNLYSRGAVWAITDAYDRTPLYLDELGELQFTPKANTIGTDAIQDGSITTAKLADSFNPSNTKTLDSVALTKDVNTKLFSKGETGYTSIEGTIRTDWMSFPLYTSKRFEITNLDVDSVTIQKLLVRKKNAIPIGNHYMGDWDSSTGFHDTSNEWANNVNDVPKPATAVSPDDISFGSRFRDGYWWRIKNTSTINDVTYNENDILVYKALLAHTSTIISNPSTQLGWKVYPSNSLVRKAKQWDPNESPINPIDNFNFEYEGECVEIDENLTVDPNTGDYYRIGDLIVYQPNANSDIADFVVKRTYDITELGKDESMVVNGSPADYEYRPTTDTTDSFSFNFDYSFDYNVSLFEDVYSAINLYNEYTGITDTLSEINALSSVHGAKLNQNGRSICFYDKDEFNNTILHTFDTKERIVRVSDNRNVLVLGDSIANHFYSGVTSGINELDTENTMPARAFTNHGKGSYNSTHMLEAYKYYVEQNSDIASRILIMVGDWDDKFGRSHEVFSQIISMMTSQTRRYILTDYYRNQRILTYDTDLGRFTANNNRDINGERELFETYGNALEGTGSFVSYTEMTTKTPEALELMASRYDPQFPDFNNELEVVEEFGCLPFFVIKSSQNNEPTSNPNAFIGKFQGYLSNADVTPTGVTTDLHYYLTDSVQTRTIEGVVFSSMKTGSIIWYSASNGEWNVFTSNDLHPGGKVSSLIKQVYKRLFNERNWI